MKMKSLFLAPLVSFLAITLMMFPSVFEEGGGNIECPQSSGPYSYISGSAVYQVNSFEVGEIGVLFCEYMKDFVEANDLDIFAEINVVYHLSGELSQELIEEYGCGSILAEQYSSTYVSSSTHFASAAYSADGLIDAATDVVAQIEELNLATICLAAEIEKPTVEAVKEIIVEHEVIDDTSTEIIKEQIETIQQPQKGESVFEVVLPEWIKNNAGWWSTGEITNDDFATGIEFLINNDIIRVPVTESETEPSNEIPDWVKNNAGWWSEGLITDEDFVNGLQFLISNGVIDVG